MDAKSYDEIIEKLQLLKTALRHHMVNNRAQVKAHVAEAEAHLVQAMQLRVNPELHDAEVYHAARELLTAAAWAKREAA